ncbi:MAG TPA: hypothetical protein VNN77_13665 [candidate division Zixibacteria bacterium]|nr:hypothetical protein [candidate division Zixibacteria bacterium]
MIAKLSRPNAFTGIGLTALLLAANPATAVAQAVRSHEDARRIVTIENLSVRDGTVSGEIRNRSPHTVRGVELLIRHTWLWANEFKPGKDDPGTAVYYTVPDEIKPGGTARFNVAPDPPLPRRSNGTYSTTVSIAGFTEVIPQSR